MRPDHLVAEFASRRRPQRAGVRWLTVIGAALILLTACADGEPDRTDSPSAEPDPQPTAPDAAAEADPATATSEAVAPADPENPPEPADGPAFTVVANPRPGDLRTTADGDLLPADYVPEKAETTLLDLAYGPDPAQVLDLFLPTQPDAPVVLFLHSGGWVGGDNKHVPAMIMRFVERGYAVASVEYRLAPEHEFPAAIEDAKRATRWLKAYALDGGSIDGDRIVAYGTSSGGLLAVFLAATPGRFEPTDLPPDEAAVDSSVVGVVSAVGPTDLVAMYVDPHPWALGGIEQWLGCSPCDDATLAKASPVNHLGDDLPPAYWAYGADDSAVHPVEQGAVMAEAWAERTGPENSWLDVVDGTGHNLDHTLINQRFVEWFIDQAVGRSADESSN